LIDVFFDDCKVGSVILLLSPGHSMEIETTGKTYIS